MSDPRQRIEESRAAREAAHPVTCKCRGSGRVPAGQFACGYEPCVSGARSEQDPTADREQGDREDSITRRIRGAREEGWKAGIEGALRVVNAEKQSHALARDRAAAAGRDGVASHRQSDVEACEAIEARLRALSSPAAPTPNTEDR